MHLFIVMISITRMNLRKTNTLQWLVSWVHIQVIRVCSLAVDLLTKSVTVTLSRHICASPHVGDARRIRPVLEYRITDLEA